MKTIFILILCLPYLLTKAQPVQTLTLSGDVTPPVYTVTLTGTADDPILNFLLGTQSPNLIFAGPSSGVTSFKPTFRALVTADAPFAVNKTESQSIAGTKTFTSDLSISSANLTISGTTGQKLKIPDGTPNAPSLVFTNESTSGLSYSFDDSLEFITGSFTGLGKFEFRSNGTLNLNNNHDGAFLAGSQHLDINIFHQSQDDGEDGGVSVSTDGKFDVGGGAFKYHTCAFGGRTSGGTYDVQANTVKDQALVAFIGKGYADGWESTNRGAFVVYAADNHETTNQPAYCTIQTTRIGPYDGSNPLNDHISLLVDAAGNAGLTYNKIIPIEYPDLWSDGTDPEEDFDSRFFTVESQSNTTDVGLFLQNNNAAKGINIWLDNDQDISYFDNIRNANNAAFKFRLKTAGTAVIAMTINAHGSNVGGGTPSSRQIFSVGLNRDLVVNSSGKISKYYCF